MDSPPKDPSHDQTVSEGPVALWRDFVKAVGLRSKVPVTSLPRGTVLWVAAISSFVTAIVVVAVVGVFQNTAYEAVKDDVWPWLISHRKGRSTSNLALLVLACGWGLWAISLLVVLAMIDSNRKSWATIAKLESTQDHLTNDEIAKLRAELAVHESAADQRRKEQRLIATLGHVDRELYILATAGAPAISAIGGTPHFPALDALRVERLIQGTLNRCFEIFGMDEEHPHYYRAGVYTRNADDPDTITIKWSSGLPDESKLHNRWYIGNLDPKQVGRPRGVPGSVFVLGVGRANADIRRDPDFCDPYPEKRVTLPYKSTLHVPIWTPNNRAKIGVLSFDSQTYVFTDADVGLIDAVAKRLAPLLQAYEAQLRLGG